MKFLAAFSFGVVAVAGLSQRNIESHEIYTPTLSSKECCKSKGFILCGTKIKDCCDAKKCESKKYWWVETEWCPGETKVEDSDPRLNCQTCADICKSKPGMAVCSSGLTSGGTTQCCKPEDCEGTVPPNSCKAGTLVDLGKCIEDSYWNKIKDKLS